MTLKINGEIYVFDKPMSLLMIMQQLKIEQKVMAAAVNMQIVKKDQWESFYPVEGDTIELLHFVGGG